MAGPPLTELTLDILKGRNIIMIFDFRRVNLASLARQDKNVRDRLAPANQEVKVRLAPAKMEQSVKARLAPVQPRIEQTVKARLVPAKIEQSVKVRLAPAKTEQSVKARLAPVKPKMEPDIRARLETVKPKMEQGVRSRLDPAPQDHDVRVKLESAREDVRKRKLVDFIYPPVPFHGLFNGLLAINFVCIHSQLFYF